MGTGFMVFSGFLFRVWGFKVSCLGFGGLVFFVSGLEFKVYRV